MPPSPSPAPSYHSSTDSSFANSAPSSPSDSDTPATTHARQGAAVDSGDEGVIGAGKRDRKRKRKSRKGKGKVKEGGDGDGDEEGGEEEGGVGERVRARREGRSIKKRKPLPSAAATTVDVDELWAKMNSAPEPVVPAVPQTDITKSERNDSGTKGIPAANPSQGHDDNANFTKIPPGADAKTPVGEEAIAIKRTYVFAGETITEEKVVPKSSAEARLYLESQTAAPNPSISASGTKPPLRRPKKRASMFDTKPETAGGGGGSPLSGASKEKGPKLNTIEKSKLDWAGYVDKEGIKEELDVAEKAKDGYLGKVDFLGRVDAKREDQLLSARRK